MVITNLAISNDPNPKVNRKRNKMVDWFNSFDWFDWFINGEIDRNVAPIIAIFVDSGSNIDLRAASGAFNLEGYTARPAA